MPRGLEPTETLREREVSVVNGTTKVETLVFECSICGEPSTEICVYCAKDACANHRCQRCGRCSDCCECGVTRDTAEEPAEA